MIEAYLAQSGDCLDIMRCYGKTHFRKGLLSFLNHPLPGISIKKETTEKIRTQLIDEAWLFIQTTKPLRFRPEFSKNEGFMEALLTIIKKNKEQYPLLSTVLEKPQEK